jgi:hypothetical protein
VIIAKAGSTYEKQIAWLFDIEIAEKNRFSMRKVTGKSNPDLDYVSRLILEELGIETTSRADAFLETMLKKFGNNFPSTPVFSKFARETAEYFDSKNDPDEALLGWMEHEEKLFRTFEYQLVAERLKKGFGSDVDSFVSYSLQVQNRRKSRSGRALENHLEQIFIENDVRFTKYGVTENNSKPDFLFPGVKEYRDQSFPEMRLSMLGVKTTCKDRWRQVLAEAARISRKHLFTLEPGISENQTNEMNANRLQLVIPSGLFKTYSTLQQKQLLTLSQFISLVKDRQ